MVVVVVDVVANVVKVGADVVVGTCQKILIILARKFATGKNGQKCPFSQY